MTNQNQQFNLWKKKQKIFYDLYDFSIQLWKKSIPWNNLKLSRSKRYKLWKKYYKSYLITKNQFLQALNIAIFRDNLELNNLQSLEMLYSFKTF